MKSITSIMLIAILVTSIVAPVHIYAQQVNVPKTPDPNTYYKITGAGATFPFPLIDLWRTKLKEQYHTFNLNYQSIGSGGGIKQHMEKTADFGASDAPLTEAEYAKLPGATLHIPETIGAVTLTYNLPGVPSGLKLSQDVIAGIFLGKITKWNDKAITALNPDVKLPDADIVTAHRSDGSGTTFVFTSYLADISPEWKEKVGAGKTVPWPVGLAAAGNEGVAGIVKSTKNSIGYVELAYVFQNKMTYAAVENGDKSNFVLPSLESTSKAAAGAASSLPPADGVWTPVEILNAPGKDAYPIASFTYLLLYENLDMVVKDLKQAEAVVWMVHWMVTEGQKYSPDLLYVPLPQNVVELDKQGLSKIKFNGQTVWNYGSGITSDLSKPASTPSVPKMEEKPATTPSAPTMAAKMIPDWIKSTFQFYLDGKISDAELVKSLEWLINNGIINLKK
jgi:phosphate ABC transporter phosphate-binding protein